MGHRTQQGFTVIEVILVLAITSLMITGILAASGVQVRMQHYREGVESFRDTLAGVFEDIDAAKNDKGTGTVSIERCRDVNNIDNTATWRGAANCFFAGRAVTLRQKGEGTELQVQSVKSYIPRDTVTAVEKDPIYQEVTDENSRTQLLDWGVQVRYPKPLTKNPYHEFQIRVIRDPRTGAALLQQNVNKAGWQAPSQDIVFCVANPYDLDNPSQWLAVTVARSGVNATNITTGPGKDVCGGA